MANSRSWEKIFFDCGADTHDFDSGDPFPVSAQQIKESCQDFKKTAEKEVRVLCMQATRESRPDIFKERKLFLLPVKNGFYNLVKGEGYLDIPEIESGIEIYRSSLSFILESSLVGNSEMQHLDFAYASSLIRTFIGDDSLVLTIRGRKYTPKFSFRVGKAKIDVESVQTEVDAGYEGADKIVLFEAKNSKTTNTIIRQLYYPFRQWSLATSKEIFTVFFEKRGEVFHLWQYGFEDESDYNSHRLIRSHKYKIDSFESD